MNFIKISVFNKSWPKLILKGAWSNSPIDKELLEKEVRLYIYVYFKPRLKTVN